MSSALDDLLESIHPARTLDETSRRVDDALNTFPMSKARITDWAEFQRYFVRFLHHVEVHSLRLPASWQGHPDGDFEWNRCCDILRNIYGGSGDKVAFELVRTGQEGGLGAVLRRLVLHMAQEYGHNEINARVSHYWDALSVAEQISVADEYLEKYGHLLPSELTEKGALRIRANMWRVLQEHPNMLR